MEGKSKLRESRAGSEEARREFRARPKEEGVVEKG